MTNTTELRKKLEKAMRHCYTNLSGAERADLLHELLPVIQSEIEAAEEAKVEEVVKWLEGGVEECEGEDVEFEETLRIVIHWARIRFLTKLRNEK